MVVIGFNKSDVQILYERTLLKILQQQDLDILSIYGRNVWINDQLIKQRFLKT